MKNSTLVLPALGLCLAALACQPASTETGSSQSGSDVAAHVGSRTITVAEIDSVIIPELKKIEMERYQARKQKLEELINEALLAEKAKSAGITTDELAEREITSKVTPPEEKVVKEYYDRFKAQGGDGVQPFEEIGPRIREALTQQAATTREKEFYAGLRKESKVAIELAPPRVEVSTEGGIKVGPESAPIKLVEFSDYQCPFCARSQVTVEQVLAKYGDKVHHVFMDFPLTSIHPMAKTAALAARCADEQGKFAAYHKVLFERQRELSPDNMKSWAKELSLDAGKFDACLASGRYDKTVEQTVAAGQNAGVSGTPGFFVNGIPISGAQPFDVFEQTIESELSRG